MADRTVVGDATFAFSEAQDTPGPSKPKVKKKVKAKMTVKEKKERGVRCASLFFPSPCVLNARMFLQIILEKVCSMLPLEFRGGDPVRRLCEHNVNRI
jgi:DASH complex subunit DAM1